MELAARRHRSAVIAGLLKAAYRGLGRLARLALYRRRGVGSKPPRNAVGAD
jgi:hypothetical protein